MERSVAAFTATVVLSTLGAVAAAGWIARRGLSEEPAKRGRLAVLWHPLAQLLVVCGLVFVNQVLCSAYIVRVHHGDPSFVTQYLGRGWFAIAKDEPVVRFVAAHIGDGRWLAPTVLRVQAFLELPFTIFAYLAVARMLGRRVQRFAAHPVLLVLASASFTIAFSLVELSLQNPWTTDDLILRAISAVVTPVWVIVAQRFEGGAPNESRPASVAGLGVFLVGAGAIAYLVLALYDAFLLYNLVHLVHYALGLAIAIPVAVAASYFAPRIHAPPSPAIDAVASALAAFTIVFFVPSLVLRYWGDHAVAQVAGCLLIVGAAVAGFVAALRRAGSAALVPMVAAIGCGVASGAVAGMLGVVLLGSEGPPERALAGFALCFLATTLVTTRGVERLLAKSSRSAGIRTMAGE